MNKWLWIIAALWVLRLVWKVSADVWKNLSASRSSDRKTTQDPGGIFETSAPSWAEFMRGAREMGNKGVSADRYEAPDRYRKMPGPQSKKQPPKRRKSKVKVRAGWFS